MMTRIITGACLIALLSVALSLGGWVFSVLCMATLCLSMYEVYTALKNAEHRPVQWPSWLCLVVSIPLFTLSHSVSYLLPLVAGACILISAVVMFRPEPRLDELLFSVMPLYFVLLPGMCMLGFMRAAGQTYDLMLTISAFGIPLFGDTMALFMGKKFGRTKLCPAVSPNKTVEGALAGLGGSVVFAILIYFIFSFFVAMPPFWHFPLLGLAAGTAGQLGDLFASLIKRHCGIKDFGHILPGHGGMMDRLDSVYWATVVLYVYLNLTPLMIG